MYGMTFNGIKKDYVVTLRGKRRPPWAPLERKLLEVPGLPGAYHEGTNVKPRPLPIPILIESTSLMDLQRKKEDLANWLITDSPKELVFDDEPDRIYYAMVDGSLDIDEIVRVGIGIVNFICPDPYKYSREQLLNVTDLSSAFIVQNLGTVDTPPTFDIELKGPTTYLDVIGDEDYMRIGEPATVTDTTYKKYEQHFGSDGTSLVGWADAGFTLDDGGVRLGTMASSSGDFVATDYGTSAGWHGPAKQSGISSTLNDYIVRVYLDTKIINNQRGRTEVYLLSDTNQVIGKLSAVMRRPTAVDVDIYIKNGANWHIFVSQPWRYGAFFGYLDIIKEGNTFTAAVAQQGYNEKGQIYTRAKDTYSFTDLNNDYQVPLYAVGMHIGAYGTTFPTNARIRGLDVQRINKPQTGVEYIGESGDIFTFDHKNSKILKNGELFTRKDFGARFFNLKKGSNVFVMNPQEVVQKVDVSWRERYR